VSVSASLSLPHVDRHALRLRHLDVTVDWRGARVKFERVAGRFTTLADLVVNEVSKMALVLVLIPFDLLLAVGPRPVPGGRAAAALRGRGPALLPSPHRLQPEVRPQRANRGVHQEMVAKAGMDVAVEGAALSLMTVN